MKTLADANPSVCTLAAFPNPSREGRQVNYLRVTGTGAAPKAAAFIIGGIHAREWAPPDAVLTFVKKLVEAYAAGTGVTYPAWSDATEVPPIPYAAFSISPTDVRSIVDTLDVYIAPVVNPDGRAFALYHVNWMWRKNRRPNPAGGASIGVDLNRNFEVAWDVDKYYEATVAASDLHISLLKTAASDLYHGDAPLSEPETKNIAWVVNTKRVAFFCDVHSYGRKILHPWSMETNQSLDPTKTFTNANWDAGGPLGGRDGTTGTVYEEFFPNGAPKGPLDDHRDIGKAMKDAILAAAGPDATAQARSTYSVEPSIGIGYVSPGDSKDYVFSRGLTDPGMPTARAFTIECGVDAEGENGFHPPYGTKFPKIEREVHAALYAFLKESVTRAPAALAPAPPPGPAGPAAPAPAPAPTPVENGPCVFALVLGAAGLYAELAALRATRDRLVARRGPTGTMARGLQGLYRRVSPLLAGYLRRYPRALSTARWAVALPARSFRRRR